MYTLETWLYFLTSSLVKEKFFRGTSWLVGSRGWYRRTHRFHHKSFAHGEDWLEGIGPRPRVVVC